MTPNVPSTPTSSLSKFPPCRCRTCQALRAELICCPPPRPKLRCTFPPCPCQKCKAMREAEAAAARAAAAAPPPPPKPGPSEKCGNPRCPCVMCKGGSKEKEASACKEGKRDSKGDGKGDGNVERKDCECSIGCCHTGLNFCTFITETIAIIAFILIAITVFWIIVGRALVLLAIKIYHSERNVQLLALAVIGLLTLSIAFRALFGGGGKAKSSGKFEACLKSKAQATCKRPPVKSASAPAPVAPCPKPPVEQKNITITITDDKAREIFRQSKLYAIPGEMKQPPALLVYLRDVILRNY